MFLKIVVVGALGVNCLILADEQSHEGVVVDPGAEVPAIMAQVEKAGITVKYVINTHGHFDHVGGNRELVEKTGAELLIHQGDLPLLSLASKSAAAYGLKAEDSPPPARYLTDGLKLPFGRYTLEVLHTPGHSQGGCSLYLASEKLVITGDTLFAESVGRTDFPGCSHEALIHSIRTKLLTLPDDTVVWPGHGPSTTIGNERAHNPYLAE